jgi:type II secretory pathway pseudopilin PulG
MPAGSTQPNPPSPQGALRLALSLTQRLSASRRRPDQGLTLIEGLVAIIVIAVTIVSITPPIFWATGTRVQNRKVEQASQIAQGEIDRVRAIVERGGYALNQLPPVPFGTAQEDIIRGTTIRAPNAPTTTQISSKPSCNTNTGTAPTNYQLYIPVDTDNPPNEPANVCKPEFLVQTFRSLGVDSNGNPATGLATPEGFVMGVRVYASVAEAELRANRGETRQASLKGTSGLGGQRLRPLAVQYSTIVRSIASQNLSVYRKLCPASAATSGQC